MNIVLIGYRGTGKEHGGRLLAARLGREFVSTDAEIVKRARTHDSEIVTQQGMDYFRDLEFDICRESPAVTNSYRYGGGAILRAQNVEH